MSDLSVVASFVPVNNFVFVSDFTGSFHSVADFNYVAGFFYFDVFNHVVFNCFCAHYDVALLNFLNIATDFISPFLYFIELAAATEVL